MTTGQKAFAVLDLIRISKQYGTLLLMMPALWALFLAADGKPSFNLLLIFIAGSFIMRSAGCVINDIADRHFDGHVKRTQNRPIPSGRLTTQEAVGVFAVLLALALWLVFQLNPLTRLLSLGGVLLAIVYPFSKRFTYLPQVVMGATFGWGSIMAWTAVRGTIELPVLFIFMANLFWATAYDTIYAVMDREDDLRIGVKSTAILFGSHTWIGVGLLFAFSALFFVLLGFSARLGTPYFLSIGAAGAWFFYQSWRIRLPLARRAYFSLFKSNVGVGFLILFGILGGLHF